MILLDCLLIRTTKRIVFHIHEQAPEVTFQGEDDGPYYKFTASNGYEVISRSRMDIQSERIWLWGGTNDDIAHRSGTMVFPSDAKRDECFIKFKNALWEWGMHNDGAVILNGEMLTKFNVNNVDESIF